MLDPNQVVKIAKVIAMCDFGTTVSGHVGGARDTWFITVGELQWHRHLVVEDIRDDGADATLLVLSPAQSDKPVFRIDKSDVTGRVTLLELVADKYVGVKKVLRPR